MSGTNGTDKKSEGKAIFLGLLSLFFLAIQFLVLLPVWYILGYNVLATIEASTMMWVMFWIYVPASFVNAVVRETIRGLRGSE